jgi:hypothetical protein
VDTQIYVVWTQEIIVGRQVHLDWKIWVAHFLVENVLRNSW